MLKYFIKRMLGLIPMLLVISALIFFALEITPGDPITRYMSPEAIATLSEEALEKAREAYGLDGPAYIRYFKWLFNMFKGDMGVSILSGYPVSEMMKNLLPYTILLSLSAIIISTIFGVFFGALAAIKRNSWVDHATSVFSILGISFPNFFIGISLILLFAIKLQWFPVGGRTDIGLNAIQSLKFLVLPAVALSLSLMAALMRYTRSAMLDVLNYDYVKTARAKGLSRWRIYVRHVFRNAVMPVSVLICMRLPMLIGGAVIIETVFTWPGAGSRLVGAIAAKDYAIVMMITFLLSILALIASVLIDLFTAFLDPRVRLEKEGG